MFNFVFLKFILVLILIANYVHKPKIQVKKLSYYYNTIVTD